MKLILVAAIVITTMVAMARKVDSRIALLAGGAALTLLARDIEPWLAALGSGLSNLGLFAVILPATGFACVVRATGCDRALVELLVPPLRALHHGLIPATVAVTMLLSCALTSPAAAVSVIGVVLVPTMIACGVHPALAASTLIAGSWGGSLNPGGPVLAAVARAAGETPVAMLYHLAPAALLLSVLLALGLVILARLRNEHHLVTHDSAAVRPCAAQPDYLKAALPFLPLALLLGSSPQLGAWGGAWRPQGLHVFEATVASSVTVAVLCRQPWREALGSFSRGALQACIKVMAIIIAAGMFVAALEANGVISAIIAAVVGRQELATPLVLYLPFALAALTGSRIAPVAACLDFTIPHAESFGLAPRELSTLTFIGGVLGKLISPVAAVSVIAAGQAGVNVWQVAKRCALAVIPISLGLLIWLMS
ncbi:MAG: C4-dicarboxylate transporter DcuC [Burkholderiaceae bacterium]